MNFDIQLLSPGSLFFWKGTFGSVYNIISGGEQMYTASVGQLLVRQHIESSQFDSALQRKTSDEQHLSKQGPVLLGSKVICVVDVA